MSAVRPTAITRAALTVPLTAAVLWLGSQVVALRNSVDASMAFLAEPTACAVVDLARVFDELKLAADSRIQMEQLANSIKGEATAKGANLDRLRKELEGVTDETARSKLIDQIALTQLEMEEWKKLKQLELDRESSLMWTRLFRAAREEAQQIAETSGYQLVLVDDSRTDISPSRNVNAPMAQQAQQQIASLRVLYAGKTVDITQQVIVQLNNKS